MTPSNKQTELTPNALTPSEWGNFTEDVNFKMRRSFSWDQAFFTNEGFLDGEELSSMIDGDGDGVNHEFDKIAEIETLEAKLFEEIDSSNQKSSATSNLTNSSIKVSSGKKDSQAKKVTGAGGPRRAAPTTKLSSLRSSMPIKTQPTRSPTLSPGNNVKSSTTTMRRNVTSKKSKATTDSPSKTPPGIRPKNKVPLIHTSLPKTSPASPVSPGSTGSSSSTSAVKQRSKRANSAPRRSVVNEKLVAPNARRKDERKTGKPTGGSILKTPSNISLKHKPPPGSSYPTSPLGPSNSSSTSTTQRQSESYRSRLLDHLPKSGPNKTGSSSGVKAGKVPQPKSVAVNTGLKTNSQKKTTPKTSKNQSSVKVNPFSNSSSGMKNIFIMSPEVLDIKGKLSALKMEISMQKKDRCKETKKVLAESAKGVSK